jgi:serine/threonine protein kinase
VQADIVSLDEVMAVCDVPPAGMLLRALWNIIAAHEMALTSGTKFGPYQIESLLGAGGMGEVYRARDARLNRDVAIKILPASFSSDADRLQRFAQESRAAAALNHPQHSFDP